MQNIQNSTRPNYINIPMYRKGIEDKLASGHKAYEITCVDLKNRDRNFVFQIITPKSLSKINDELKKLEDTIFYNKYQTQADSLYAFVDEIGNIDDMNTSILYTVS